MSIEDIIMNFIAGGAGAYIVIFLYVKIREQLRKNDQPVPAAGQPEAKPTWIEKLADKLHGAWSGRDINSNKN